MGYIRHHAIIVTGTHGDFIDRARERALAVFSMLNVSPIVGPSLNVTRSFFVGPDGSKESWADSDLGDGQRDIFIRWLNGFRYSDGSSPLAWVEVQYGDDNGETVIGRHSDQVKTGNDYTGPAFAEADPTQLREPESAS